MKKLLLLVLFCSIALAQFVSPPPDTSGFISTSTSCGGNLSGTFPNCNSASAAPVPPPNGKTSGMGVEFLTGLNIVVGKGTYVINGITYTVTTDTALSFTSADATNPRVDAIIADTSGTVSIIAGTPANPALPPDLTDQQLLLAPSVSIPANATTPANVNINNTIFTEGSEWAQTYTTHIALSTANPHRGTHDMEFTSAVLGNNVKLLVPASGTVDLANSDNLVCWVAPKAVWATGTSGSTAARNLVFLWKNGTKIYGQQLVLKDGTYGFSTSNPAYQQVVFPTASFQLQGIPVNGLFIQVGGPTGTSTLGAYVDDCTLQGGLGNFALPTTLMKFKGTWNSTANYNVNDTVVSGGIYYTALASNTNVAVSTATTWAAGFPTAIPNGTTATTQSASDNSTKIATTAYVDRGINLPNPGSTCTFTGKSTICICTTTCTIAVPVPVQGYQFCAMNDLNVSTVITLSAIGSSSSYANQAMTAYGTAGTGTLVSGGAVKDQICILGRDSTHYLIASSTNIWTAN